MREGSHAVDMQRKQGAFKRQFDLARRGETGREATLVMASCLPPSMDETRADSRTARVIAANWPRQLGQITIITEIFASRPAGQGTG